MVNEVNQSPTCGQCSEVNGDVWQGCVFCTWLNCQVYAGSMMCQHGIDLMENAPF